MEYIVSPIGKTVPLPFITCPNYQDITLVKAQIRWCEQTAEYYLQKYYDSQGNVNYFLNEQYIDQAKSLRDKLRKLAR